MYEKFNNNSTTLQSRTTVGIYLYQNVSETGFYIRLQVNPTQLATIDRASPYLRTSVPAPRLGIQPIPYGKVRLSSDYFYPASSLVQGLICVEFINVSMFCLALADGLCCAWLVYPILVMLQLSGNWD
jgi:hypothetical protein